MKRFFGSLGRSVVCCALFSGFFLSGESRRAEAQIADRQRKVNETVASLERARRLILETSKLRTENEDLIHYFRRVLTPTNSHPALISADTQRGWRASLERAVKETAIYRMVPSLLNVTAENQRWWAQCANALKNLPLAVQLLNQPRVERDPEAKAKAYTHAILVLVEARDALRNARP